ncbi:MAG: aminopeptidase [Thermoplasmata archaeon]|jgi:aspartyl aminopeptidase|nr:MAG: aminopeptidase [Aciduliprofundum sp.]
MDEKIGWLKIGEKEKDEIMDFSRDYMEFLRKVKTEREAVTYFLNLAEKKGFRPLGKGIKKNGKYYLVKNEKAVAFVFIGDDPEKPYRIIASHIDSPRLDLKPAPIVEDKDSHLVLFKTHYYGGIKKYQWVSRPLAIHGIVVTKSGKKVNIVVGEEEDDPVFTIPDLLPHLSRKVQGEKKLLEGFEGEDLQLLISHIPEKDEEKSPFKKALLKLLKEKYSIEEDDLYSADLEVVPASQPRDVGLDRSMLGAYGQDDRICAYTSVRALLDSRPENNTIVILFDKEEIGSDGNVGAQSNLVEYVITKVLDASGRDYSYGKLLDIMHSSKVISADVNAVVNPLFKQVHDMNNAARAGNGVIVTKYTGSGGKYSSSEAQAELMAEIRNIFDSKGVIYQFGLLGKVDEGGGGTVAKYLARYGMNVVDIGPGLLSMHSPFEVVSKLDLWSAYRGYKAFIEA